MKITNIRQVGFRQILISFLIIFVREIVGGRQAGSIEIFIYCGLFLLEKLSKADVWDRVHMDLV